MCSQRGRPAGWVVFFFCDGRETQKNAKNSKTPTGTVGGGTLPDIALFCAFCRLVSFLPLAPKGGGAGKPVFLKNKIKQKACLMRHEKIKSKKSGIGAVFGTALAFIKGIQTKNNAIGKAQKNAADRLEIESSYYGGKENESKMYPYDRCRCSEDP